MFFSLKKEDLKYGALAFLAVQNCAFWLLSFYTRQFPPGGVQALSSTLVVVIEFVKMSICLVMVIGASSSLQRNLIPPSTKMNIS